MDSVGSRTNVSAPIKTAVVENGGGKSSRSSSNDTVGGSSSVPVTHQATHSGRSVASATSNSELVDQHSPEGVSGKADA